MDSAEAATASLRFISRSFVFYARYPFPSCRRSRVYAPRKSRASGFFDPSRRNDRRVARCAKTPFPQCVWNGGIASKMRGRVPPGGNLEGATRPLVRLRARTDRRAVCRITRALATLAGAIAAIGRRRRVGRCDWRSRNGERQARKNRGNHFERPAHLRLPSRSISFSVDLFPSNVPEVSRPHKGTFPTPPARLSHPPAHVAPIRNRPESVRKEANADDWLRHAGGR